MRLRDRIGFLEEIFQGVKDYVGPEDVERAMKLWVRYINQFPGIGVASDPPDMLQPLTPNEQEWLHETIDKLKRQRRH